MNLKKAKKLRKSARQIVENKSMDGNITQLVYKEIEHPPKPQYYEDGTVKMFSVLPTRKTTHDCVRGTYQRLKKLLRNGTLFK